MPQFDKKRADDAQGPTPDGPDTLKCPNCGSTKTTIAGTIAGRVWVRCDECRFNFSTDADSRS